MVKMAKMEVFGIMSGAEREIYNIVYLLLSKGANINIKDRYGQTALMAATWVEHDFVVKLLLDRRAHVNAKNHWGNTALDIAIMKNNLNIVKLLRGGGAEENWEIAEELDSIRMKDEIATLSNKETIEMLLDKKVNVITNNNYSTPLIIAIKTNSPNVKRFIDKGMHLETRNIQGDTPLICAIDENNEEIIHLLLAKGVNINARDYTGATPLIRAIQKNNKKIIHLLLDKGANVNAVDYEGRTPLMHAIDAHYCIMQEDL